VNVLARHASVARAYGGPVEALIGYVRASQLKRCSIRRSRPAARPRLRWLRDALATLRWSWRGRRGLARGAPARGRVSDGRAPASSGPRARAWTCSTRSAPARRAPALRRRHPVVIGPFGTMSQYTLRTGARGQATVFSLDRRAQPPPGAAIHFTTPAERDRRAGLAFDFGARPMWSRPVPRARRRRRRRSRPPGAAPNTVLFLGRLHPVKGVDILSTRGRPWRGAPSRGAVDHRGGRVPPVMMPSFGPRRRGLGGDVGPP